MNRPWEPPRLYSWTVVPPDDDGPGAVGITDDEQRAMEHATEVLRTAPAGARGLVYRVTLSSVRIAFHYDGLIARGCLDPESGAVTWEDLRNSWDGVTQGIPPEALATGIADVERKSERRRALGIPPEVPGP